MDRLEVPMPAEIRNFLEDLLKEANIDNPDPGLKEMMLEDLYGRLQVRFMQVLAERLEGSDLDTYTELSAEDQGKALEFLQEKEPNMPQYFFEAMQEFKQTFLS